MNEHREQSILDREVEDEQVKQRDTSILRPLDTAARLGRLMWQEFELSRMAAGWVPGVRQYEHKLQLGRFAYLHSRNMKMLYERIGELPGSLSEKEGTPAPIREAYERISQAADAYAFYIGYLFLAERQAEQYDKLLQQLDSVLDAPTVDQLRYISVHRDAVIHGLREQLELSSELGAGRENELKQWGEYVALLWVLLDQAGDTKQMESIVWPAHPTAAPAGPIPEQPLHDEENFPMYRPAPEKAGGRAYDDEEMSPLFYSVKQMHYINATEISAAQSLCYMYYGVQKMPLAFYFDLMRHTWDEFRHSEMGVRRLKELGYETKQFKFFGGGYSQDMAKEFYADMYAGLTMVAEPCSFIKKRKSAEAFWEYGDARSAVQCEFDMVDERMHVDFGKKWGPELYRQAGDLITAAAMSERARERRLGQLGVVPQEEIKRLVKSFPAFCGLSTVELNYSKY
ncbi:DUF455 family protein [Paenibacillus sp. GCM10023252]|uniref:DUF455 family protein n=1 Tax=Paenibacillus sp. GCM10023252 TaxID=3252649 RepID=UPI00360E6376